MKAENLKQVKTVSILIFLLGFRAFCQNMDKSKPTSYTIAYTSKGVAKIYSSDKEGKSNIKSINTKGDYLALSPDGKTFAFRVYHDDGKTWSIHTMNSDGTNSKRLTHAKNKWDSAT